MKNMKGLKWIFLLVGVVIGMGASGVLFAEEQAAEERVIRSNISKAKNLYTVVTGYAVNHEGVFPPDRVALYSAASKVTNNENDIRGIDADGDYWDFVFVPGVTKNDRGWSVLAYSPMEAGEPRVVLHVYGLVETMSNKELELALAKAKR